MRVPAIGVRCPGSTTPGCYGSISNRDPTIPRSTAGYETSTEINTEAYGDIVPPCQILVSGTNVPGTGMSNPDLAENGVIRHHAGIAGIADLDPSVHGWTNPVATIVVERIG